MQWVFPGAGIINKHTRFSCGRRTRALPDFLLHITDMAWKRVKHPSEIVNVGDEVTVKVLKFDKDHTRVSLSLKQLGQDPWVAIAENHPVNSKLTGKVTNLTNYG